MKEGKKENSNANEQNDNFFIMETPEEEKQIIRSTIGNRKIWSYFIDLLRDKTFLSSVAGIREYSLDKDGRPKNEKLFQKRMRALCRNFGLDEIMWLEELELYVLKGTVPKENLATPCIVLDRIEMGEDEYPAKDEFDEYEYFGEKPVEPIELESWSYSHPIIIRVSPYASQTEIIDYIKKTYTKYIKPIQERYVDEDVYLGKVRKKKQSVQKRNDFIYENREFPRKKIMSLVAGKFKEYLDVGHIGKIIYLEKKKRENK